MQGISQAVEIKVFRLLSLLCVFVCVLEVCENMLCVPVNIFSNNVDSVSGCIFSSNVDILLTVPLLLSLLSLLIIHFGSKLEKKLIKFLLSFTVIGNVMFKN